MMKLIQNIDVYAPQHLGKKDVLIINDKIVKIKDFRFYICRWISCGVRNDQWRGVTFNSGIH